MNLDRLPYLVYPNPRLRREGYSFLNGIWDFAFLSSMEIPSSFPLKIKVPFAYESKESLIDEQTMREYVGYRTIFSVKGGRYLLHFEGVDYECLVYVDKKRVFSHKGGYTPFAFPLSLEEGEHELIVLAHDSFSKSQMRGKQRARSENYECWYTQYTGIYKDVYLERIGGNYVKSVKASGDKRGVWSYSIELESPSPVKLTLSKGGKAIRKILLSGSSIYKGEEKEEGIELYSSSNPSLYDLRVEIPGEDEVSTYFAFRSIEAKEGRLFLNDEPLYLRMILNQGYYENKGVSGESQDVLKDLTLIKEIGFNGIRIHQKQESNAFYYIADCFGIYLWSELPSCYEYGEAMKEEIVRELPSIIERNYNSPSVLSYVLFNESWGIPKVNEDPSCQAFVREVGKKAKSLDPTRLAILNDGWFQLGESDILSLHEYEQDASLLRKEYESKEKVVGEKIINHYGKAFAEGNSYQGQPIILSEFGGASLSSSSGWGYGDKRDGIADYVKQLEEIFDAVRSLGYLSGYCYTQLTDVEQETNGLFYFDRTPKIPLEKMRSIILGGKDDE